MFLFSYIIRFLSRVAEHSSVNKMTPSNLAICIGCSLLCPKDQSSNSFTKCSIIIELMIVHHKQLFPQDNQSDQPDLIPTGIQSNENLLDMEFLQPLVKKEPTLRSIKSFLFRSPKPSGKHRPAPPPPAPPISRGFLIQIEPTDIVETSAEHVLPEKRTG